MAYIGICIPSTIDGYTTSFIFLRGSLYQTGNDLQEDPTTHGSEPLNRIQDH